MVKMVNLKRTASERKAEDDAGGMDHLSENEDGADLHLRGEHIKRMDEKGELEAPMNSLPHGHPVEFSGHGTVHRTSDGPEGGNVHIKVHKLGMDYDEPNEAKHGSIRDDLEKSATASQNKSVAKDAKRVEEMKPRPE